jgi:hypothetical protein
MRHGSCGRVELRFGLVWFGSGGGGESGEGGMCEMGSLRCEI